MNNKKIGNDFEQEYAEILSKNGWWVTLLTPKKHIGSQPADIIAVKNNKAILIDCKTSESHLFPISRIESNQRNAYKKFNKCGNDNYYLVIKYNQKNYKINMNEIDFTQKSIDLERRTNEDYSF